MMALAVVLACLGHAPALGSAGPSARHVAGLERSPPAPFEVGATPEAVAASVASLDARIRAIDINWPTGAVVASFVGALVLVGGLTALLITLPFLMATAAPLLTALAVSIAGAGLLIGGLVVGSSTAAAARAERDELMREREWLQHLGAPPTPGVERLAPGSPVVLARF
ncbi:MAG: hypothetical protein INH41_19505 [Myxococcaceae bacterium]|jgi:hypothetical protein|nr:hypothetical protein [Myxococcaceae bacterium]MCA3014575.1 hypothetical protein [Myxococcaceae bacterium]